MAYYTGIGSRETPHSVLIFFSKLGVYLENKGYTLRSGGAEGADKAFEKHVKRKEIFLPWKGFNNSTSDLILTNTDAYKIAEQFHPYWYNLKQGAKKLQARNSHQILGKDLQTPSNFVICWTKNGKGQGGTGQAIRMANWYKIPVFDCGNYGDIRDIKSNAKIFLSKFIDI